MTDRQSEAIREMMNIMRSDQATVAKALTAMTDRGFTAEEAQFAVNEIAARVRDSTDD